MREAGSATADRRSMLVSGTARLVWNTTLRGREAVVNEKAGFIAMRRARDDQISSEANHASIVCGSCLAFARSRNAWRCRHGPRRSPPVK